MARIKFDNSLNIKGTSGSGGGGTTTAVVGTKTIIQDLLEGQTYTVDLPVGENAVFKRDFSLFFTNKSTSQVRPVTFRLKNKTDNVYVTGRRVFFWHYDSSGTFSTNSGNATSSNEFEIPTYGSDMQGTIRGDKVGQRAVFTVEWSSPDTGNSRDIDTSPRTTYFGRATYAFDVPDDKEYAWESTINTATGSGEFNYDYIKGTTSFVDPETPNITSEQIALSSTDSTTVFDALNRTITAPEESNIPLSTNNEVEIISIPFSQLDPNYAYRIFANFKYTQTGGGLNTRSEMIFRLRSGATLLFQTTINAFNEVINYLPIPSASARRYKFTGDLIVTIESRSTKTINIDSALLSIE